MGNRYTSKVSSIDILALIIFAILILSLEIVPNHPDGILYRGLADNLLDGTGYFDTIRNDNILPAILHPALLAGAKIISNNLSWLIHAQLFTSSAILFFLVKSVSRSSIFAFILILFSFIYMPKIFGTGAMESTIFLFLTVFLSLIVTLRSNSNYRKLFLIGVALFLLNLTQPIFLPLIYAISLLSLILFLASSVSKCRTTREISIKLATTFLCTLLLTWIVLGASYINYGDSRYVTGTFGAIGLYTSFNNYLPVDRTYASNSFKKYVSKDELEVALEPLKKSKLMSWQDRRIYFMGLFFDYIQKHPRRAFAAYFWRFKQYLWPQRYPDSRTFSKFFFFGIFSLSTYGFFSKNRRLTFVTFVLLTVVIYVVAMRAVFQYAGLRYHLSIYPLLLVPTLFALSIIFKLSRIHFVKIYRNQQRRFRRAFP